MSSGEVAALITAVGISIAGIITSIAAIKNAEYSAQKVKDLETRIGAAESREKAARKRVSFLKKLLMQRESEINRLLARDASWKKWGDEVGRLINQLQLEVGALHYQLRQQAEQSIDVTQPLPFKPPSPEEQ